LCSEIYNNDDDDDDDDAWVNIYILQNNFAGGILIRLNASNDTKKREENRQSNCQNAIIS
jgi:hypothetical protein